VTTELEDPNARLYSQMWSKQAELSNSKQYNPRQRQKSNPIQAMVRAGCIQSKKQGNIPREHRS